jgi:pantetheine-phosphate adenylyltransferase
MLKRNSLGERSGENVKIAVYPGSFDPVTNGHIDIIERAAKIFDKVYVAIIVNPEKTPLFDIEEREKMLTSAVRHVKKAKVESFKGLLVDYAKKKKAGTIVRGLRAVSDFDFEFQMALTNLRLCPSVETVFIMTDYKYSYLSSSLVKQLAHVGGSVKGLVPDGVIGKLKERGSSYGNTGIA